MQEYTLEIASAVIGSGIIRILRDYLITLNSSILKGTVSKVKNKTVKGRRYNYPKVIIEDDGGDIEKSFPSAKKRGHDYYAVGEEISVYKYKSFIFRHAYKPLIGFWFSSVQILLGGIFIVILSFFV